MMAEQLDLRRNCVLYALHVGYYSMYDWYGNICFVDSLGEAIAMGRDEAELCLVHDDEFYVWVVEELPEHVILERAGAVRLL